MYFQSAKHATNYLVLVFLQDGKRCRNPQREAASAERTPHIFRSTAASVENVVGTLQLWKQNIRVRVGATRPWISHKECEYLESSYVGFASILIVSGSCLILALNQLGLIRRCAERAS